MKVLADTSVWIEHFRTPSQPLIKLLADERVVIHPFVIGELACGGLRNRAEVIRLLRALPTVSKVSDDELLFFIDQHQLMGRGLGLVDIHLLASAQLAKCALWTADKTLKTFADRLG